MNFSKIRNSVRAASIKSQDDDEYSYAGSSLSQFDSEDDSEYNPRNKRLRTFKKFSNESNEKITRKPTRVPNMKISNRNALLARENRKRKKEMMETLEKTVEDLQNENKKLQKMMKFKDSKTEKLIKEVQYLKSVIANRTEIVSVLKSLPQFPLKKEEMPKQQKMSVKKEEDIKSTISSSDTLSIGETSSFIDDNNENDFISTEWNEILKNPFSSATDFSDIPKLDDGISILTPSSSPSSEISTEHNYSHFDKELDDEIMADEKMQPGVCIHVRGGRVSLEFCSVCHYNATTSWIEQNNSIY